MVVNGKMHARAPRSLLAERCEREGVLERVREAAAALKSYFGARRVVLFGSLAGNGQFMAGSDVDLAVEGIGAFDY